MRSSLIILSFMLAACGKEKCTEDVCDPNDQFVQTYQCRSASRDGLFVCYDTPETFQGYRTTPSRLYKDCKEVVGVHNLYTHQFTCLRITK